MKLALHTQLEYTFAEPTDVLLQIEAAVLAEQVITDAWIDLSRLEQFGRIPGEDGIGDRVWLRVSGNLSIDYTATVTLNRQVADLASLPAVPPHQLPGETVRYLLPSRYCPSDEFQTLVEDEFGGLAGGERIAAIQSWIAQHFTYSRGVSNSATGAMESYVMRSGVCRDFSHVAIALARASAIPARYVSCYAPRVAPPDFHAVAEVYLDGAWHIVDATGMADPADIAIIGVGRDAADVSFMTSYGTAMFNRVAVSVHRLQD